MDDFDDYNADVYYAVYMNGGDPDAIDFDMVEENYYGECGADEAAVYIVRNQRKRSNG